MRVAFLTPEIDLAETGGVAAEYARRLATEHGCDVTLVAVGPSEATPAASGLSVASLHAAMDSDYDVAVSTSWESAGALFDLTAQRYAAFVQTLHPAPAAAAVRERFAAAMALDFPVVHIAATRRIARALDDLWPGNHAFYVRPGIAKDADQATARVPPAVKGPLRILVEASGATDVRGTDEALAAAAGMGEARHVTLVTADGSGDGAAADRVVGGRTPAARAALYAESDVVLCLSVPTRPLVEAFHVGATCVVTPAPGHEEYLRHLVNGLVVDWDDRRGAARALDLLARNRALLHELRTNALATARAWPSWEQQGAVMAAVLARIRRLPPRPARAVGRRMARDLEANLAHTERQVLLRDAALAEVAAIHASRAYRWSLRLRRVARPVLGPLRGAAGRLRRRPR